MAESEPPLPNPEVTQLVALYKTGQFDKVVARADELLNQLGLAPENPLYVEIVMQKAWALWRKGEYEQSFALANQDAIRDTEPCQELRVYAYAYQKSPYRRLRGGQENPEGLIELIEKLGPENLAAGNAQLIYDLGVIQNEEKILNPDQVIFLVNKFRDSNHPAVKVANLLQNAALWEEKHNHDDKNALLQAIEWLQTALRKYDPDYQHQSSNIGNLKNTPHAHHIAGLYFRMYKIWLRLDIEYEARQALQKSVAAWSIAHAQDPKNEDFEAKYAANSELLQDFEAE